MTTENMKDKSDQNEQKVKEENISCETLAVWLASAKKVLLIDCRAFLSFTTRRVRGAHSMRCNSIKMRRCKGKLPVTDIVPDDATRTKLQNNEYECVVIYDENKVTETCKMAYRTIVATSPLSRVVLLQEGVSGMESGHPGLIEIGAKNPVSPIQISSIQPAVIAVDERINPQRSVTTNTPEYDQGVPVNIVDHLYLGSAAHAAQCELLERLGITALLNVSPNCPNHWPDKFEYETIPVEDNSTADIKMHFRTAIDFINDVKSRGGKVLVHCKAGVSRSATLCLAYLISCRKMCLNDAYDEVKSKRRVISPNFNFMGQLLSWQEEQLGIRSDSQPPLIASLALTDSKPPKTPSKNHIKNTGPSEFKFGPCQTQASVS